MTIRSLASPRHLISAACAVALGAALTLPAGNAVAHPPRHLLPVAGGIAVQLDFATLTATSVHRGTKCLLQVQAVLEFTGSVAGSATGSTAATVDAPCEAATSTPPGTYSDTFRFRGDFSGTVSGTSSSGALEYAGVSRVGGDIAAVVVLRGNAQVLATVQSTVGGSGSYRGAALL